MKSMEQTGPEGAGTVTAACIWQAGEPTFELTVHPAVLRAMPWFRGGARRRGGAGRQRDAGDASRAAPAIGQDHQPAR